MSFKKFFLALGMSLLGSGLAFAGWDDYAEMQAVSDVSRYITQINLSGSPVWPGFQITEPVVIFFPNEHVYAFNHYHPWKKSFYQILSASEYYYDWQKRRTSDGDEYYFLNGLNNLFTASDSKTWKTVENQEVFIDGLRTETYDWRNVNKFVYNYFSQYELQDSDGFKSYFSENAQAPSQSSPIYIDLYQQTNIDLMYLEFAAMKDYALHNNMQALKYYAAINQVRLSALTKESQAYEKNDGLLSGTAEYVSWKVHGVPEEGYFSEWHAMVSHAAYDDPRHFAPTVYTFAKHFNRYATPLIGAGLDKLYRDKGLDPDQWKKELEARHISASEALQNFYNLNLEDAKALVVEAKNLYNFDPQIMPTLTKTFSRYQEFTQKELDNYHNLPGVEVAITLPNVSHHYKSGMELPIDNQTIMEIEATGRVFNAAWGEMLPQIQYTNIPYIFYTNTIVDNQHYTTIKFKISVSGLSNLHIGSLRDIKPADLSTLAPTHFSGLVFLRNNQISIGNLSDDNGVLEGTDNQLKITISGIKDWHFPRIPP